MASVERVELRHPSGTTAILIGPGAVAAAVEDLASWLEGRTLFVVTTPRVRRLHSPSLAPLLAPARRVVVLEVEEGEGSKRLAVAERLWRAMLAAGGKRDSRLLAFGGGSVGDLGGFVAGCFLRGIEYVQAPTTLLAQVDASIGGKTGVDLPEAKNSVGLFHHPAAVVAETAWLATLEPAELHSGLMEVVKVAVVLDAGLFALLEEGVERLVCGDAAALSPLAAAAARLKVGVVERDPREDGERRLLNFGHTLGHAIEAALGYRGLRHGEAVGWGMLFAVRLAERRGLEREVGERLRRLLRRLGLPPLPELAADQLLAPLARDKKGREEGLVWVLPAALGRGEAVPGVAEEEVRDELGRFLAHPGL